MIKIDVFDKSNFLFKFRETNVDLNFKNLSIGVFNEELDRDNFLRRLHDSGLDILVTSIQNNYLVSDDIVYELNIIPYNKLGNNNNIVLLFKTADFDTEEVDAILKVPEINEIYLSDSKLQDIVNSMVLLGGGNWKVLFNYLTEIYGFKFQIINYTLPVSSYETAN